MSLHERAFIGLKILILGDTPLLPMKIEQAIAKAHPHQEVQLSSFENYEDAYKFCKMQRDVGLILLLENNKNGPFMSVFRELAQHSETQGMPCFGVILYEDQPHAFSAKMVGKNSKLLDYLHINSFLQETEISQSLEMVWNAFTATYENEVMPQALQDLMLSIAEENIGNGGVHFICRLTNHLISHANLSWIEVIALKWAVLLPFVEKIAPVIVRKNKNLLFFKTMMGDVTINDSLSLGELLASQETLVRKIFTGVQRLELARTNSTLKHEMDQLVLLNQPGAPFLIRHISKSKDRIMQFAQDSSLDTNRAKKKEKQ